MHRFFLLLSTLFLSAAQFSIATAQQQQPIRQIERLDRGVVAIKNNDDSVFVSWRLLATDPEETAFNLYRQSPGAEPVRLNAAPLTDVTTFVDDRVNARSAHDYFVRPVWNGREYDPSPAFTIPANAPAQDYLSIPLQTDLPHGARGIAVGDLTGDGRYDFVVKRGDHDIDPSQPAEPEHHYHLEAYTIDGEFLWRFALAPNIRPGIWYTPFLVYDFDGDGRAEVAVKIGDLEKDHSDAQGRDPKGPEYLAILDGRTGEILAKADWPERGEWSDWGDGYGNRADRHLMGVAYLDGERPSLLAMRGTYTQLYVDAWDWREGGFSKRWRWHQPEGGGFHQIRVGDVTGDGRDEVINGSIAISADGETLWNTGQGHGDRMHMTRIDPDLPGKQIWYVQESPGQYEFPILLVDARNGEIIWGKGDKSWGDVGRGTAMDIDPRHDGLEVWASRGELYSAKGEEIGPRPRQVNFGIWWDGDLLRELLDGNRIDKWDYRNNELKSLAVFEDAQTGSRNAPMGYGDVVGDWREEVWYVHDKKELRIYTTTIPTEHRFVTFMHDTDYRTSVACLTIGYMQSTQPSFYFAADMKETPHMNSLPPKEEKLAETRW